MCLFAHQYRAVLVTLALQWVLKSGSVSPQTLFFLGITLTSLDPLTCYIFKTSLSIVPTKYFEEISLRLQSINEVEKNQHLTMTLPTYEHEISLH